MSHSKLFLSWYKTYPEDIPAHLQNRTRSIVTFLLEKVQRVSTVMIDSVREQTDEFFEVWSDDIVMNIMM